MASTTLGRFSKDLKKYRMKSRMHTYSSNYIYVKVFKINSNKNYEVKWGRICKLKMP